jgi:hypothetical protein
MTPGERPSDELRNLVLIRGSGQGSGNLHPHEAPKPIAFGNGSASHGPRRFQANVFHRNNRTDSGRSECTVLRDLSEHATHSHRIHRRSTSTRAKRKTSYCCSSTGIDDTVAQPDNGHTVGRCMWAKNTTKVDITRFSSQRFYCKILSLL